MNDTGTLRGNSAISVPSTDQHYEGEGMTEFTMRRLRNEIIEQCAHVAENFDHRDTWSDDPDMNAQGYVAAGETCDEITKAIRGLKR